LNNWIYGGSAFLGVKNFGFAFKYFANPLFKKNNNYEFNTYSFGLSWRL
jgi:hypothetical protein